MAAAIRTCCLGLGRQIVRGNLRPRLLVAVNMQEGRWNSSLAGKSVVSPIRTNVDLRPVSSLRPVLSQTYPCAILE